MGCIVLAGGKGRRLGKDKAGVELGGRSLLERAIYNLDFLDSEIIVVKAPGQELPGVSPQAKLKVVTDIVPGKGPLVGIYTGLRNSTSFHNLVVACDMPFINRGLIEYMIKLSSDYDVAIPRVEELLEPLQAIYSRDCMGEIEKLLAEGNLKVDRLLSRVKTRYIEADEIERFDPQHLSFFNINSPADLKRAEELLNRS